MASHTIYITKDCLMNCTYCYEPEKENKHLSEEDTIQILERLYQIDSNPTYIEIGGGEPLLNWDAVLTILRFCQKYSTPLVIITNGVLLSSDKIHTLQQYNVLTGISYDGRTTHDINRITKDNKKTEAIVKRNILLSLKQHLFPTVCMTFQKINAHYIENDIGELVTWYVYA